MFQQIHLTAANDARVYRDTHAGQALGGAWSEAHSPARTRPRSANLVLSVLCSVVASLSIEDVGDRSLLFEQYDFKLWSYRDRLGVFCFSVLPSLAGMAVVSVAYKAIRGVQSMLK